MNESKKITPFISADANLPEFTLRVVILGVLMAVIMGNKHGIIKNIEGKYFRRERGKNNRLDRWKCSDRGNFHASRILHRIYMEPVLFNRALHYFNINADFCRNTGNNVRYNFAPRSG
jgi:hypothetical protein